MKNHKYQIHPELLEDSFTRKSCDYVDCAEDGLYKAPMSRNSLNTYYWFCLNHVREYNSNWNYYAGMNESEVESRTRFDYFWERPTWPFGVNPPERQQFYAFHDPHNILGMGERFTAFDRDGYMSTEKNMSEEAEALKTMDLFHPLTQDKLKARYKELVKKHHPDKNGGCLASEEKLKTINKAYDLLKKLIVV